MNIPTCVICESEQEVTETLFAEGTVTVPFCQQCRQNGRAAKWIETELAEAMAEDPGLVRQGDGTWAERQ